MVVCGNDEQYRRFCEALNHPELATDERFISNPQRVLNRRALARTFDAITSQWKQQDLLEALQRVNVPAGPIYDLQQVFEDPQVKHRHMAVEVPHPLAGTVKICASPIRLSETPVESYTAPPTQGQHTAQILKDLLAFNDADLERLSRMKVI